MAVEGAPANPTANTDVESIEGGAALVSVAASRAHAHSHSHNHSPPPLGGSYSENKRMDYQRFSDKVLPLLTEQKGTSLSALAVWTQIRSFLKGSIEAALEGGVLSRESYLDMGRFGREPCRLLPAQRKEADTLLPGHGALRQGALSPAACAEGGGDTLLPGHGALRQGALSPAACAEGGGVRTATWTWGASAGSPVACCLRRGRRRTHCCSATRKKLGSTAGGTTWNEQCGCCCRACHTSMGLLTGHCSAEELRRSVRGRGAGQHAGGDRTVLPGSGVGHERAVPGGRPYTGSGGGRGVPLRGGAVAGAPADGQQGECSDPAPCWLSTAATQASWSGYWRCSQALQRRCLQIWVCSWFPGLPTCSSASALPKVLLRLLLLLLLTVLLGLL